MIDLKANPFYLDNDAIAWVENTLAGMTTEEKTGQLFCVLFKEAKPEEFDYVYGILSPGGCMYRVVSTARAVAATQALRVRSKVPLLIAANLEKEATVLWRRARWWARPWRSPPRTTYR